MDPASQQVFLCWRRYHRFYILIPSQSRENLKGHTSHMSENLRLHNAAKHLAALRIGPWFEFTWKTSWSAKHGGQSSSTETVPAASTPRPARARGVDCHTVKRPLLWTRNIITSCWHWHLPERSRAALVKEKRIFANAIILKAIQTRMDMNSLQHNGPKTNLTVASWCHSWRRVGFAVSTYQLPQLLAEGRAY